MTTLQVRAIEHARLEMERARKQMQRVRLQETRYRGLPTVSEGTQPVEVHGTFVYRGHTYTK